MTLDIGSRSGVRPDWLDAPERDEAAGISAEMRNQRIARETGAKCLPTASLDWEAIFVSGEPGGALTPTNAQSMTRASLRQYHARRAAFRGGHAGLLRALRAA